MINYFFGIFTGGWLRLDSWPNFTINFRFRFYQKSHLIWFSQARSITFCSPILTIKFHLEPLGSFKSSSAPVQMTRIDIWDSECSPDSQPRSNEPIIKKAFYHYSKLCLFEWSVKYIWTSWRIYCSLGWERKKINLTSRGCPLCLLVMRLDFAVRRTSRIHRADWTDRILKEIENSLYEFYKWCF